MTRKVSPPTAQVTDPSSGSLASRVRGLIVAGISSSIGSQNAVRWAAAEAERRTVGLRIVHAYPLPQLGQPVQHDVNDLLRNEAAALLEGIADGTRRDHPHLAITTRPIPGAPVNALRDESWCAALTVVGAKESSRLAGAILGSVASEIAAVNPAPVAVVHPDHPLNGQGPVVVGIDATGGSSAAIEFAFAEAAVRNAELLAVHAWNQTLVEDSIPGYPSLLDPATVEQEETAVLSEALAGWRDKYPDVVITHEVRRGGAATVLLEYCRSASIVVVGRRPRGEFQALVLGSTSRSLTAHSPCPVVIVRSPDTDHSKNRSGHRQT
jgi:nucleotide-binding universal stress UspA family protein